MKSRHIFTLFLGMIWATSVCAVGPTTLPATTEIKWQSATTGATIDGTLLVPAHPTLTAAGLQPTIIYLKNLAIPRLGQEPDESILADLLAAGDLVLVLDYQKNAHAVSPDLNADMLKLR